MNKEDILHALEPFTPDIPLKVRIRTANSQQLVDVIEAKYLLDDEGEGMLVLVAATFETQS